MVQVHIDQFFNKNEGHQRASKSRLNLTDSRKPIEMIEPKSTYYFAERPDCSKQSSFILSSRFFCSNQGFNVFVVFINLFADRVSIIETAFH